MSDHTKLLKKFESGTQSWADYEEFLELESTSLEPFFKLAYNLKTQSFGNNIKI